MKRSSGNESKGGTEKQHTHGPACEFELTFNQAVAGIAHTSLEGVYLRVNPRLCEMLGYTEQELLGRAAADFVSINPDRNVSSYRQLILEGRINHHVEEQQYRRKDGSLLWVNRTLSLARDAAGKPLHFIRVIEDITERKQAGDIIARDRALLRTIIDSIPGHIYAKDKSGKFILANKAWLEARGEINPDIAGKTAHDFFRPSLAERLAAQDRHIIETGNPMPEFEHKLAVRRREDGPDEVRWGSTVKVPLRSADGEVIGSVGISQDITEQRAEEVRRHMSQAVTQVLAQSLTLHGAIPRILKIMCEALGWKYGARWAPVKGRSLPERTDYWSASEPEFDSRDADLWLRLDDAESGGLLRRAWTHKTASWITDLYSEETFRRKASAKKLGWKSAYAFPVLFNNKVTSVLEFFGPAQDEPDEKLLRTISTISSQIGQFIQRKEAEDKLAFLARFDTITGLPNRFLITDRLRQLISQAQRNKWAIGVLFVDLDRFKIVNDTHGHAAGDQLLQEVAKRLKQSVRDVDSVGRLSGDEFAVLLSNLTKQDDAALVAQKIISALAVPFEIDGQQSYISASVGIALYPGDNSDAEILLKNADTAMYRAKELGRNGYQFYVPQMDQRLIHHKKLDAQLHVALEREEFLLHYQPKVSLATGAITGFEALLRWQHEGKLVPPSEFIPIMEETGLIVPVGEWVLGRVCEQINRWKQGGIPPVPVAVNLSMRQFQRKNLANLIGDLLGRSRIDPPLLKLELTETLLMSDAEESIAMLHQLNSLGAHLSVDDFGTGYSSLAYLKRFPLNELKIDRAFIRDATTDPDDAAIALAIINLAHSLKLNVVAEGVETLGQLEFLKQHNCDEIQGYYFARPMPLDECTLMLTENTRLSWPQDKAAAHDMRLLLVADKKDELNRLTRAFAAVGYRIYTASDAKQGFERLAEHGAEIVISDNDMPDRSGIEFLTKVRQLYPNALRVLTSSGDVPTVTRATNNAGIHLFLPKNWTAERLCTEVREALQTQKKTSRTPRE